MRATKRFSPDAFSLVEVVVAIGIVAFAVLSTFALLSVATDTSRKAREDQSAAQLVQNEFQRIRSLSSQSFPVTNYVTRYFDINLVDLGITPSTNAVYQLQITIEPYPTPTPVPPATPSALLIFNAEVRYPANAPAANQTVSRFTMMMNNPL